MSLTIKENIQKLREIQRIEITPDQTNVYDKPYEYIGLRSPSMIVKRFDDPEGFKFSQTLRRFKEDINQEHFTEYQKRVKEKYDSLIGDGNYHPGRFIFYMRPLHAKPRGISRVV